MLVFLNRFENLERNVRSRMPDYNAKSEQSSFQAMKTSHMLANLDRNQVVSFTESEMGISSGKLREPESKPAASFMNNMLQTQLAELERLTETMKANADQVNKKWDEVMSPQRENRSLGIRGDVKKVQVESFEQPLGNVFEFENTVGYDGTNAEPVREQTAVYWRMSVS